MVTEPQTQEAGTALASAAGPHAYLVIHIDRSGDRGIDTGGDPGRDGKDRSSRVVDLPDGVDVTFGRSRGTTVNFESEKVSRNHARIRRTGDVIEVEDLGSRNGTRVNGDKIEGITRLQSGDEVSIGPILAIVGVTSGLRVRSSTIADPDAGEARLTAEVDRSVRYHRPLTVGLIRCANDAVVDAMSRAIRPMDLIAEDAGDDYLVVLPELARAEGVTAMERLLDFARTAGIDAKSATALCPEDGTTVEALIGHVRAGLRAGRASRPSAATVAPGNQPVVLDAAMRRVYSLVDRIADTPMTVLILGETGVGKELVAEAIHTKSSRRERALIKLNCAALPETLLESELFGYERGAFTGADKRKIGFFEAADGGTLFLDEIGEMPLPLQAKLLRVLERKVITRVGGTTEIPTDARLVAATHRDLDGEVRAGRFRQDLLYRIGGFTLVVPPLRDRAAEIVPLAEHFARTTASEQGRPPPVIAEDAREALAGYSWPGNVRELKNAIERALVLCGEQITSADLPDKLRDAGQRIRPVTPAADMRGHLAEVERAAIVAALESEDQNQTRAARRLGLSRRALIYKMEKYGLKPPPARDDGVPK